ncbi:DUF2156 domain-containing protein [bacterium]|nr:DUF2156 domain-containing protein [bacterium]
MLLLMTLPDLLHANPLLIGIVLPGTLIGLASLTLSRALPHLTQRTAPLPHPSGEMDIRHARAIIDQQEDTAAFMALLGDKELLFSESDRSFLMAGRTGSTLVTHGATFGEPGEAGPLMDRLLELASLEKRTPLFSMVGSRHAELLRTRGLEVHKLGEEALLSLGEATLRGPGARNLRNTRRRLARSGCSFEIIPAEGAPAHFHDLQVITDRWLRFHNTPELRFSLGRLTPDYLKRHPLGMVCQDGQIVAFANLLVLPQAGTFTLDLLRFDPGAPNGIVDFLIVHLIEWGIQEGYHTLNLGLSPLTGLDNATGLVGWGQRMLFDHGEALYPFQGMYRFKRKFHPEWQPRYIATLPGLKGVRALLDYMLLVRS